jgi:hypothetical protein
MTDWEINDKTSKLLESPYAPHETAGVLRTHRAGWAGGEIAKELKVGPFKVINALRTALDQEQEAAKSGRDIYDALIEIPKEKQ